MVLGPGLGLEAQVLVNIPAERQSLCYDMMSPNDTELRLCFKKEKEQFMSTALVSINQSIKCI